MVHLAEFTFDASQCGAYSTLRQQGICIMLGCIFYEDRPKITSNQPCAKQVNCLLSNVNSCRGDELRCLLYFLSSDLECYHPIRSRMNLRPRGNLLPTVPFSVALAGALREPFGWGECKVECTWLVSCSTVTSHYSFQYLKAMCFRYLHAVGTGE